MSIFQLLGKLLHIY